jgi:MFS_1 like family
VRSWGSAGFIAGTLGGGLALDLIAQTGLIWAVVAVLILNAAAAAALRPLGKNLSTGTAQRAWLLGLVRDPRLLALAAAAGLIQARHAIYYGFSTLPWQTAGWGGMSIGALWALGVVAENRCCARGPGWPGRFGTGVPCGHARRSDGSGNGSIRRALCPLGRARLCGNGVARCAERPAIAERATAGKAPST